MLRDGRLPNRALQRMLADYQEHLAGYVIGEHCRSLRHKPGRPPLQS